MRFAVLDTNIYISGTGNWVYTKRRCAGFGAVLSFANSAVVLSELRRGARTRAAQERVDDLYRVATLKWEPSVKDWWEAGQLVRKIGDDQGWDKNKRRDFQNDTLIALTVRKHGATLVTADFGDFDLLAKRFPFDLLNATINAE